MNTTVGGEGGDICGWAEEGTEGLIGMEGMEEMAGVGVKGAVIGVTSVLMGEGETGYGREEEEAEGATAAGIG